MASSNILIETIRGKVVSLDFNTNHLILVT